jgi:hypothetical protein
MTPHVMFMHFEAHGEPAGLAAAVRDALGSIYRPAATREDARTPDRTFDVKAIETVLGRSGAVNPAGILQVSVPRAAKIVVGGHDVPPAMGVATALNFQPTGGGNAAITGDFVLVARKSSASRGRCASTAST